MILLTPHQWIPYGRDMTPICEHCGITSVEAQKRQPETKGAGPCPVRFKEWLERHEDGPDTIP